MHTYKYSYMYTHILHTNIYLVLLLCSVGENDTKHRNPKQVLYRIYGEGTDATTRFLSENGFIILSERGIGKFYTIFLLHTLRLWFRIPFFI